jgi:glycosyltransferase involved in cell wall biosynthesis
MGGIPAVATVHGLDWQRAKWKGLGAKVLKYSEGSMLRNVDRVVVVSRELQRYYAEQYGRETVYIPNGVEPVRDSDYTNSTVLQEFGLTPRHYLLYLGRLVPEKRVEDLILAYRAVHSSCKLVIAGESGFTKGYVASLRFLAAEDPRVVFTGLQKHSAAHGLLHNASVVVAPSALEGLPMSLLECMQHGTPAVVSDIPPHRELLGSIAGYDLFFPTANTQALRAKLELVLGAQVKYRQIAEDAKAFVSLMHSWPAIAARTEALFYSVLDDRAAAVSNPAASSAYIEPRVVQRAALRLSRR